MLNSYAKRMNFAHCYFGSTKLHSLESLTKEFNNFYPVDIQNLPTNLPNIELIYIEIDEVTKEKINIVNKLVKHYGTKCINLLSATPNNSFLLKFALHFSLNKVLEIKDEKDFLLKSLNDSIQKCQAKLAERQQLELSRRINSFMGALIFHEKQLMYANDKAFDIFDLSELDQVENFILSNESLQQLLDDEEDKNQIVVMENSLGEEWKYNFFLTILPNKTDRLISVIPHRKIEEANSEYRILNRFNFVEFLKDKLVQYNLSYDNLSLLIVNIKNYQKIVQASGSIKVHDFFKKFITKLGEFKEEGEELAQWNPHCFIILVEHVDFDSAKERLEKLHEKLVYSKIDTQISPIITSSALKLINDDINEIILHVENIESEKISYEEFMDDQFFEITHLNEYMSEEEQIEHYLHSCIANKTSLKLLNIYKGLCINTQSKVHKFSDDSYFLSFETLQGYSMEIEGKTVIQSPDFPYDISADVSYVNFDNSLAILNNFVFLKTSANSRLHTRVQPSTRTMLSVTFEKLGYQGEIIDISINSIGVKFTQKINEKLKNQIVRLVFKLADEENDFGFVEMKIEAKVTYIAEVEPNNYKMVFILDELPKPYDAYLLRYMYKRQKELIIELKKSAKANQVGRKK